MALNNLLRLICHKTQQTNQPTNNSPSPLVSIVHCFQQKAWISLYFLQLWVKWQYLHTKWWFSDTSLQVYLPQKQCLLYRKFSVCETSLLGKWKNLHFILLSTRLAKAWTAIDRLLVIWNSDLFSKIKCNFFQAVVMFILLYRCTIWTLTKCMEKKLDSNCTTMLRAILNKSWKQHPAKQQWYSHWPLISKTIKIRRTRHAGHCWRSKDKLISDTSHIDSFTRTRKCRTNRKNLFTSVLFRHKM